MVYGRRRGEVYPTKEIFVEARVRPEGRGWPDGLRDVLRKYGFRRIRARSDRVTAWRWGRSPRKRTSGDPRLIMHKVEVLPEGIRYTLHNKRLPLITPAMEEVYRIEGAGLAARIQGNPWDEEPSIEAFATVEDEYRRTRWRDAFDLIEMFVIEPLGCFFAFIVSALIGLGGLATVIALAWM